MSSGTPKHAKDRHQEILDAAAKVITDRGLAETRISDIAEEAGVSPGLILYYFDSKDRLLAEALTYANHQPFAISTQVNISTTPPFQALMVTLPCMRMARDTLGRKWWRELISTMRAPLQKAHGPSSIGSSRRWAFLAWLCIRKRRDFLSPLEPSAGAVITFAASIFANNLLEYVVHRTEVGESSNYTRNLVAGQYRAYLRAASFGATTAELDKVTSDPTTIDQTTQTLASSKCQNELTRYNYRYIPLTDDAGAPVMLALRAANKPCACWMAARLTGQSQARDHYLMLAARTDRAARPRRPRQFRG